MMWAILLLAAQAAAPADAPESETSFRPVTNPGGWVTTDDYPAAALRDEHEGITGFRLSIAPDGLPRRCAVTSSSGHAELDDRRLHRVDGGEHPGDRPRAGVGVVRQQAALALGDVEDDGA